MSKRKIVLFLLAAVLFLLLAVVGIFLLRISSPATLFAPVATQTPIQNPATPTPTLQETPDGAASASPIPSSLTPEPSETPMTEATLESLSDLSFMKDRVNIMLFGIDKSEEREASGSFRTDTMILVTINFKTNAVDMISIPRDSYVLLYNQSGSLIDPLDPYGKVNSAFSLGGGISHGGYQSAMNTVSALFGGIPIQYYASVDMNAVKEVVDAMGGVDYDVDIEVTMNGRTLHPGLQHLDGQAVLDYCRQRKGSSDVARADRQQRMLLAIFQQMKSTGQIANIPKIYTAVQSNIETNLSFEQICALALVAVRMDTDALNRHMVPGEFMTFYARDCWCLHTSELEKMIRTIFGIDVTVDPNADVEAIKLYVETNRVAIAAELAAGNRAYADAQYLLTNYSSSISSADRSALQSAMSHLSTALRKESKGLLDLYTPEVRSLADSIWASLGGTGAIPSGATDPIFIAPEGETEDDLIHEGSSSGGSGIHIG